MLLFEGPSETGLFRHLSNHGLRSPQFRKYISFEGHLFFRNLKKIFYILKMKKKS